MSSEDSLSQDRGWRRWIFNFFSLFSFILRPFGQRRRIDSHNPHGGASPARVRSSTKRLLPPASYHLYLFGGFDPVSLEERGSVYYLNVTTKKWWQLAPMEHPRTNFGIASFGNKVYILGGDGSILKDHGENSIIAEVLDTKLNQWTELPSMPSPRARCSAASLDGFIYVSGGRSSHQFFSSKPLATVDRYCVATQQWESVAPMLTPRYEHKLISYNNFLYAIGGAQSQMNNIEKYDPTIDKWEVVLQIGLSGNYDVAVHRGKFYFFRGWTKLRTRPGATTRVNPPALTKKFVKRSQNRPKKGKKVKKYLAPATPLLLGPFGKENYWRPDIELYDPIRNAYQILPSTYRNNDYLFYHPSSVTIGDRIWHVENDVLSEQGFGLVEYDPATGEWKPLNFGIPHRRGFKTVVIQQ